MLVIDRSFARLWVFVCLSSPAMAAPGDVVAGHDIVASKCARCHAVEMQGTSPKAEAPPFREVVGRYPPEQLEEALAEGIVSGHPDMPQFVFEPAEIQNIIAYLNDLLAHNRGK